MKIRKMIILLLAVVMTLVLTACGSEEKKDDTRSEVTTDASQTEEPSQTAKPAQTEEPSQTAKPTQTEEPSETKKPAQTEEPSETEKPVQTEKPVVLGMLKVQSIVGITLDGNVTVPCEVAMYEKANDAYEHPITVIRNKDVTTGSFSFSYIEGENETFSSIVQARIIETNKDVMSGIGLVNHMGEIATFTLELPSELENNHTVVYQISLQNENGFYYAYIGVKVKE